MSGPRFGPLITDSGVTFRLWAPAAKTVAVLLDRPYAMTRRDGWFEALVPGAKAGARYRFRIDDEVDVADPASHFQPDDVAGPSEVIDHAYRWRSKWRGCPWHECVFLELHVGTYTTEGTFRAIIDRLDHIKETGITAVELMPLSDFPGRWNWGYDGVLPYAPDSHYGRPEDLKALIDAAHDRGLMMFLDVVYNHFGPEGNFLARYAPAFFTHADTPWGSAIDYRVPEVRAFAVENALHWLRHYRFDGLRLDAVHAIVTPGEPTILAEISERVGRLAQAEGREIHLVLENDDNRALLLAPRAAANAGLYRAQWNDDFHHAWHVLLTGESSGYYRDYQEPGPRIARALAEGFVYQGEPSAHRRGNPRGECSRHLPATAFVNFLQNHDQIGNRARGERLETLAPAHMIECALALMLLAPSPPLLFMGEEWGACQPFPFFCDFAGDLAEAVRSGRKREFAEAYAQAGDEIPDPLAATTVAVATLDWAALQKPFHRKRLELVRSLLDVRRHEIVPLLPDLEPGAAASLMDGALTAEWQSGRRMLAIMANLSDRRIPRPAAHSAAVAIWGGEPPAQLPPWSVYATVRNA